MLPGKAFGGLGGEMLMIRAQGFFRKASMWLHRNKADEKMIFVLLLCSVCGNRSAV